MKTLIAVVAAALVCAVASSSAIAEQKGQPKGKGPAGPQVRYFDLSSDVFSDLNAEVILKERRQGAAVISAELDVCHQVTSTSSRLDRFVVPLKLEGNRLVGTAQSQERKVPVAVSLTRRAAGRNFTFEGSIKSGTYSEDVSSSGNTDMSEDEYNDSYAPDDDEFETSPADFTEVSPQALGIRVNRAALPELMNAVRDQDVRIVFSGLDLSCPILRTGQFTVQLDVDPERAGAVLAKIRSVPGVVAAGYGQSNHNWERAIRFPSAGWRDAGGRLDRAKFASAVSGIVGKVLSAQVSSSSWDGTTGALSIVMKRADDTVPGLQLSRVITVSILVSPFGPRSVQQSLLWIESITERVEDEAAGAKLKFLASDDEDAAPEGSDLLTEAVSSVLKGQIWDTENEDWQ